MRDAVPRLAERVRAESWSHQEYLVACLQREVAARESHGAKAGSAPAAASSSPPRASEWVARLAEAHHAGKLQDETGPAGPLPTASRR